MPHPQLSAAAPTLTTPRLILRPHSLDDFEASLALWSDPVVTQSMGGLAFRESDIWQRLLRYGGLWAILGFGYWAITDRSDGRFIGEAGLADWRRDMVPSLGPVPESGWALLSDFHGRGLALEAMQAVLDWSDRKLASDETCCIISPSNTASLKLADKLGYQPGGTGQLGENCVTIFKRPRAATARQTLATAR